MRPSPRRASVPRALSLLRGAVALLGCGSSPGVTSPGTGTREVCATHRGVYQGFTRLMLCMAR